VRAGCLAITYVTLRHRSCFLFTAPLALARHNNVYRAFVAPAPADGAPRRGLLPDVAFTTFNAAYEEPAADEGFAEVRRVEFVFEGSAEERRRWGMWLSLDGDVPRAAKGR
jgi:bifunctional polynucleotide phosphatase/kinase